MIDKLADALRFQSQALELRSARQALLASNIANADTPGYKPVDADFAAALRRVTTAAAGSPDATRVATLQPAEVFRTAPPEASQDGNAVDMDGERARFAENAIRYEAALRTLNQQVKSLLAVIQG